MLVQWVDIENFVVEYVRHRFHELSQWNLADYSNHFGRAYAQLKDIYRNDPDYSLPLIGDAYCLKYHLLRMDNVFVALSAVNQVCPFFQSSNTAILDMGGGTGGTAMALAYWVSTNIKIQSGETSIVSFEPSVQMRETYGRLVPAFLERLEAQSLPLDALRLTIQVMDYSLVACAEICRVKNDRRYDLIIFSYALWKQHSDKWTETSGWILDVAKILKPNGVLLFLSPKKPQEKVDFMQALTLQLKAAGFASLDVNVEPGAKIAPVKHPLCLQSTLSEINHKCFELTNNYPLGQEFGNHPDDRPYYGFYGTVEAFVLP